MLVVLILRTYVFAQTSPEDAAAQLGGLSESVNQNIQNPTPYVPKYNNEQTGNGDLYGEGDLVPIDPGNAKVSGCANNPGDPNLYTRQECEGVNFIAKNRTIRPNMTISTKDPVIAGNRAITSDPRETLEKYKWLVPMNADGSFGSLPANACPATTVNTPPVYEDRRCTFYKGSENFLCQAPLRVTVNPHFNYQCQDTLGTNSTEKCSKTLIVQCAGGGWNDSCTHQGIIPDSTYADMAATLTGIGNGISELKFGKKDAYQWSGSTLIGKVYDRSFNINIVGIERLDLFNLVYVEGDDWVWIKVNGNSVFLGPTPPVVDRVEQVSNGVKYGPNSNQVRTAEFGHSFTVNPNKDIRSYLHNGTNSIWIRTIVGGGGGVLVKFNTRLACPVNCTESWNNQCAVLEQRAQ